MSDPVNLATPNANGAEGILIIQGRTRIAKGAGRNTIAINHGAADKVRFGDWAKQVQDLRVDVIDAKAAVLAAQTQPPVLKAGELSRAQKRAARVLIHQAKRHAAAKA